MDRVIRLLGAVALTVAGAALMVVGSASSASAHTAPTFTYSTSSGLSVTNPDKNEANLFLSIYTVDNTACDGHVDSSCYPQTKQSDVQLTADEASVALLPKTNCGYIQWDVASNSPDSLSSGNWPGGTFYAGDIVPMGGDCSTPTPTPTPTVTPTPTPTPTHTVTPSPSPTPSHSKTPTPIPSISTGTPTHTSVPCTTEGTGNTPKCLPFTGGADIGPMAAVGSAGVLGGLGLLGASFLRKRRT